jgi:hypothetical protein
MERQTYNRPPQRRGIARRRHHIAPVDQPLQRFADLTGGKLPFKGLRERAKALSAFRYGGCQRVRARQQKELAVWNRGRPCRAAADKR